MSKLPAAKQKELIQTLLLRNNVISEAAKLVRVSSRLALVWMQRASMREAFDQARTELMNKYIGELRAGRVDEAMQLTARISMGLDAEATAKIIQAFHALDAGTKQEMIQNQIGEMQTHLNQPIEKLLIWR